MCEPTTVAMGAGLLLNAYAQKQAGEAQGQISQNNARMARQQAGDARVQGAQDAGAALAAGRQAAGAARVAAAANGIDPNSGSMANAQTASIINSEVDAAKARSNAARAAWGYESEAQDHETQGKLAKRQGLLNALGGGLSGAGALMSTKR